MPARHTLAVAAALAAGAALGLPLAVAAHALPQSAIPPEGAEVQTAPKVVEITFGETPDPKLSSITVVNGSGANVDAGPTTVVPGHPLDLEVPLKTIGNGVYTVTWRTVSEVDGHLATGAYAFGVGVSASNANAHAAKAVVSPPPSILAVAARWLFFIGAMGMVGIAATCLIALQDVPRFATRLLGGTWALSALGAVGIVEAQREAAGLTVAGVLSSSLGMTATERIVAAVLTGLAVAVGIAGSGSVRRAAMTAAAVGAAASMWVDVAASHAGAQAPVVVNLLAQWVHIVASGAWIGGLLVLILAVRGQASETRGRAVRRFSTLAGVAIVTVAITGTFRAVIEVGSLGQLFGTPFGLLVIVKVALFVILAGLGAINRYRNVPRASRVLRGLRRVASTEVLIGAAVVLVAAALVNVAPPVASAATTSPVKATQLVVTGSDFATTVKVRLTVSPGAAGFNNFKLGVTDYDTGAPIRASSAQLEFTQPLRPQLGESTLTLKRQSDGTFKARGGNLSIAGIWEVAVIIENAQRSTEVHLQLTTIAPAPLVTATRFSGLPTLYSIQLQHGWLAQVYLDPDKAGMDEFHCTFFTNANEFERDTDCVGDDRHDGSRWHTHDPRQPQTRSDRTLRRGCDRAEGSDALRHPGHVDLRRRDRDLCGDHPRVMKGSDPLARENGQRIAALMRSATTSGCSRYGRCAIPASTSCRASGSQSASCFERSITKGRSRSPQATVTGIWISSSRDHATMPLLPDSSGMSFFNATAFIASARSRAGPETRPSGDPGPSSQSHISIRFTSSISPAVCASSQRWTRRSVSVSNSVGSGAPLTDGASRTSPATRAGSATAASIAISPPMELPTSHTGPVAT